MNDMDFISVYTWDDAVNDGVFMDVSLIAKNFFGFSVPVAITAAVASLCNSNKEQLMNVEISRLLNTVRDAIKTKTDKDNMLETQHDFGGKMERIWAVMEGRSPDNPEPVITIMLPSDY